MANGFQSSDGRRPGSGLPDGNAGSSASLDDLVRQLQENPSLANDPEFMARLSAASQNVAAPNPPGAAPSPSLPSRRPLPRADRPGAPTPQDISKSGRPPFAGLPGASQPGGFPSLPDARPTLPNASLPNASPSAPSPRTSFPAPSSPLSSPKELASSGAAPLVPPTPFAQSPDAPTSTVEPTSPVAVPVPPPRQPSDAPDSLLPSDVAPDLSAITPPSAPSQDTLESLNSLASLASDVAPEAKLTVTSADEAASLDSLNVESVEVEEKSPSVFLELLERRAAPSPDASAAEDAAMLRDQSALERAVDDAPMWFLSVIFHLILILILAFIVVNVELDDMFQVISEPGFSDEVVLDEVFDPDAAFETSEEIDVDLSNIEIDATEIADDVPDVSSFTDETAAPLSFTETELAFDSAPVGAVENLLGSLLGDDLSGRGENKAVAVAMGGGTEGSEKAVALALAWIAEHQCPDGSWTFQLQQCPSCGGRCRNSGTNESTIAATALGVMPFLAAGNTPTTGKYKRVVAAGVNYLLSQGEQTENGVSFHDKAGNMYSHGLATIALCETYAMLTPRERARYRELGYAVDESVRFIEYAQAADGGWRYTPKTSGDTSVSGWLMMALYSARLADIPVSDSAVFGMRSFLRDVVGFDNGARYYYMRGVQESDATSAIGLLCRLYLDWRYDNPDLIRGANRLASKDRNLNNPYYNYYASQMFYNVGGSVWNNWNREIREKLIAAQSYEGHERGSWFPDNPDGHCKTGGRFYATTLNCMVLEVYYRHMPLYNKVKASEAFVLEGPDATNDADEE